jgi:hypothetical protein
VNKEKPAGAETPTGLRNPAAFNTGILQQATSPGNRPARYGIWVHGSLFRRGAHGLLVRRHDNPDYLWAQLDGWPEFAITRAQFKRYHRFLQVALHNIRRKMGREHPELLTNLVDIRHRFESMRDISLRHLDGGGA